MNTVFMLREFPEYAETLDKAPDECTKQRIQRTKEGTRRDIYDPLAKVGRDWHRHSGRKDQSSTPPRRPKDDQPSPKPRQNRTERPKPNPRRRG